MSKTLQKCGVHRFLDITDENGIPNGRKLNVRYDDDWKRAVYDSSWTGPEDLCNLRILCQSKSERIKLTGSLKPESKNLINILIDSVDTDEIDLRGCTELRRVSIGHCGLKNLILGEHPHIISLELAHNQLTELNIPTNSPIAELAANNNKLRTFRCSGLPKLESIVLDHNELETVTINNTAATSIRLDNNKLTYLNLDGNPLNRVYIEHNENLEYISCKGALQTIRVYNSEPNHIKFIDISGS